MADNEKAGFVTGLLYTIHYSNFIGTKTGFRG